MKEQLPISGKKSGHKTRQKKTIPKKTLEMLKKNLSEIEVLYYELQNKRISELEPSDLAKLVDMVGSAVYDMKRCAEVLHCINK